MYNDYLSTFTSIYNIYNIPTVPTVSHHVTSLCASLICSFPVQTANMIIQTLQPLPIPRTLANSLGHCHPAVLSLVRCYSTARFLPTPFRIAIFVVLTTSVFHLLLFHLTVLSHFDVIDFMYQFCVKRLNLKSGSKRVTSASA